MGYLCVNFSLPRPLCSRLRPDVRDRQTSNVRQTDVRQRHRLMPPPYGGGGIKICLLMKTVCYTFAMHSKRQHICAELLECTYAEAGAFSVEF